MKNKEELIWSYLDGQLEAEDRTRVEKALETDPAFKELFLQSELLHQQLETMESEVPSMRFAQNVMDRLPAVKELATGPLVSVKWLRSFYGSTVTLLILLVGSTLALFPASASSEDPYAERMVDTIQSVFNYIPNNLLLMTGIVLVSLLTLLTLDRWLQKRFQAS